MCPFECDTCVFRKLKKRDPREESEADKYLKCFIRRANLDAFWSRPSITVYGNRDRVRRLLKSSEALGLDGPFKHDGPFPDFDHCGYEVALSMLHRSTRTGRNAKSHLQFDTIREFPTVFGNQLRASPLESSCTLGMVDTKGTYRRFTVNPCSSLWFQRFKEGCRSRMGTDWKPNQALPIVLIKRVLGCIEDKIEDANGAEELNRWVVAHSFIVIGYVISLRGPEGFLLDLEGLNQFWRRKKEGQSYVYICLKGKVKGEIDARCHVIPSVNETSSGINVKQSVFRLITLKKTQGFTEGPAISDSLGNLLDTHTINDCLIGVLEEIYHLNPEFFPPKVHNIGEIKEKFHIYRSLRRSSDSRALDKQVATNDINLVNRWAETERSKGSRPAREMKYHYADISLILQPFLRYTGAM